jgi:hypothetical protein
VPKDHADMTRNSGLHSADGRPIARRRALWCCAAAFILLFAGTLRAQAYSTIDFLTSLTDNELGAFQDWKLARQAYNHKVDAYWDAVEAKRSGRRRKRSSERQFRASDYVMTFPPKYTGPHLAGDLAKKYDRFLDAQKEAAPPKRAEISGLDEYLAAARRVYGFTPERVSEKEFKLRYAEEATSLGLTKEEVVRVYALETGGIGTYDMQAGVHPGKKTSRPISSALGYAQLLSANSINEVARSGATFIAHLRRKLRNPNNSPERTRSLEHKIAVLRRMYANCKRVPFEWRNHQAYAKTAAGMGVHAINVDGDIGPMLQAMKLKTLKDIAEKQGRASLSGAEIELMNLAGPMTGLEMMQPPGASAPTTNFFSRNAYYVNKMVMGLTASELLAELDRRMNDGMMTPGSQEFAAAFDRVESRRAARR